MTDPLPAGARLKSAIAATATRPPVGRLIGLVFRDRVPSTVGPVVTSFPAVAPEVKARLALRLYERAELRFVADALRPDLPVVELGASIGVVTRAIARRVGPDQRILAVEADPDLLEPLEANLRVAGITDQVIVVHAAVVGTGAAGRPVVLRRGATSTDARVGAAALGAGIEVPGRTLADLLGEHLPGAPFSLVCDIEGAEAALVETGSTALDHCQQAVMELHDTVIDGVATPWAALADAISARSGLRVAQRHGPVVVFER